MIVFVTEHRSNIFGGIMGRNQTTQEFFTLDQGNRPKRKKKNTGIKILTVLLVLVLLCAVGLVGAVAWMKSQMGDPDELADPALDISYEDAVREELGGDMDIVLAEEDDDVLAAVAQADEDLEASNEEEVHLDGNIVNYLLIGSDRRSTAERGRSDTIIILTINKTTGKIHLTSLMRAIYVAMPTSGGSRNGMLNWAYSIGGPDLAVATIEQNFKIDIAHYFIVDFSAFEKAIDCIGGVSLNLTSAEAKYVSNMSGVPTSSGIVCLNGKQALAYCRDRQDNDFNRTRRQRNTVSAAIAGVKSLNAAQLTDLAKAVLQYVTTDMSTASILAEVVNAPTYLNYPVDQRMLPIENEDGKHYTGITHINGSEVYLVDWKTNLSALEQFLNS